MKKKLLSVVLAVAVAFTFSFAMVGTASATDKIPDKDKGTVTDIEWATDYDSAVVTVEDNYSKDVSYVTFTSDPLTDKDKWKEGDKVFHIAVSNVNKYGVGTYNLMVETPHHSRALEEYWTVKTAAAKNQGVRVYDVRNLTAINANGSEMSVDNAKPTAAGQYSAWYENKDVASFASLLANDIKVDKVKSGSHDALTPAQMAKICKVTYPEYKAFEFNAKTEGNYDLDANIEVSPVAWTSMDEEFAISTGVLELPVRFNVTDAKDGDRPLNEAFDTYYTKVKFSNIDKNDEDLVSPTPEAGYEDGDATIYYDGQEHSPAMLHASKNTVVTYAVKATGTPAAAEYSATAPVFKNVGTYKVWTKVVTEKNKNNEAIVADTLKIEKRPARVYTTKKVASKPYDGVGIETEFSTDVYTFENVIEGETLITGIEKTKADVAVYTVLPVYDKAVKANYALDDKEVKAEGTIERADNNIHVQNKTYSIKKGKTDYVDVDADFGTVEFQKTSGYSKILVSKKGKITVKKAAKKGTYNIKVKATVAKSKNYASDAKTITLKVKVK